MAENQPSSDDYVLDIKDVVRFLWQGRWFALVFACVFSLVAVLYVSQVSPKYRLSLEIKPIPTFEMERYQLLNRQEIPNAGPFKVGAKKLVGGVMELMDDRNALVEALDHLAFLDAAAYPDKPSYYRALKRAAFAIELQSPTDLELLAIRKQRNPTIRDDWELAYYGENPKAVLHALDMALQVSQEQLREGLVGRFENSVALSEHMKAQRLDDLDRRLRNVRDDYERNTANQLAFLKEQAAIARSLDIKKNTIEAQSFTGSSAVVTNVKTDSPFYLRGYQAIEKEIELLRQRENKEAFIESLMKLETERRSIVQDPSLDRARAAFAQTPLVEPDAFVALSYDMASVKIESTRKNSMIVVLALMAGLVFGMLVYWGRYVLKSEEN